MGMYDMTIGTLLVGIFFNTYLYGLVTYQFAMYYRTKFDDWLIVKCMVFFLFMLDTFHSIAAIYLAWHYTVANYNNPAALEVGAWPYTITPLATALTALVTQIYLGYRIKRFTKSNILFGVVILLAVSSFILGMACSIESWIIWVLSKLPRITPLVIAWLTTQVAVDMLITTTLSIAFYRSRTGFGKTDTVLNRLIRGAIQTGLFAGIFSIGDLITFSVVPNTNFYGMFAIPIGRMYTNTLLDGLLTRETLCKQLNGTYDVSKAIDGINWGSQTNSSQGTSQSTSMQLQVRKAMQDVCDGLSLENADAKARPIGPVAV